MVARTAKPCCAMLMLIAAVQCGPDALAQAVPPAVDPGVIQRQIEPVPPALPPLSPPTVPDVTPGFVPPEAEAIRFRLQGVQIDGATVYDEAELRPLWAPLLGQEIALTAMFQLAEEITGRYRNDGYILSRALVPPQEITDGRVRLQVIEGYVDRVIIEGEPVPLAQIQAKADRIAAARPLNTAVLERNLLLLNELPGLSVESVLRPSPDVPGAADLVLVTRFRRYSGDVGLANRGNRYTGPMELSAGIQGNSLLGRFDRTLLRGFMNPISPNQLLVGALEHTQPLGTNGTELTLFGSLVKSDPGGLTQKVDGHSESVQLSISHPILLTRQQRVGIRAEFGLLNSDSSSTIVNPNKAPLEDSKDRIRTLRVGAAWDFADRWAGITSLSGTFSQGLNILNERKTGSPDLSREAGKSDFTAVAVEASRLQSLGGPWSVFASAKAQYAFDSLLVSETFDFGGEAYGRAYDSSELAGDNGIAARIELRYGLLIGRPWLLNLQPFLSADAGGISNRNNEQDGVDSSAVAASVSVGVRFDLTPRISGSVEVAQPLIRSPTIDRDDGKKVPRGFFRITATF